MSDAPATLLPDLPATAAVDGAWARPVIDRQIAILGRLAEAGLEVAVAIEAQAKGGDQVVQGDVALAYARVARAVRQTLMLQQRLVETVQDRGRAEAGRKAAARASAARILHDAIDEEPTNDIERAERLSREAAERLQDAGEGLFVRPFGEVVAEIVRDLGLTPDWLRLAEDCARAEAAFARDPVASRPDASRSGAAPPDDDDEPITDIRWVTPDGRPVTFGADSS